MMTTRFVTRKMLEIKSAKSQSKFQTKLFKVDLFLKGCYDILREGLENKLDIIIGVGVAVGLIQVW